MMYDDKTLAQKAREWDEAVEDGHGLLDEDSPRKPFDAGLVLAAAEVIEAWETCHLADAVNALRETLEAIIEEDES